MKLIRLFVLTIIMVSCVRVWAQDEKSAIIQAIRDLQDVYNKAEGLSFDVKYSYYSEKAMDITLDSLTGSVKLFSGKYKMKIDKTETVNNGRYVIMLFDEDSLMYITSADRYKERGINPADLINSSMVNIKGVSCSMAMQENVHYININYPDGMPQKRISLMIDMKTGLLLKSIVVLKTMFLTEVSDAIRMQEDADDYAVIETTFNNYHYADGEKMSELDEKNFFTRAGKSFTPVDKYKHFTIFIGTPNL